MKRIFLLQIAKISSLKNQKEKRKNSQQVNTVLNELDASLSNEADATAIDRSKTRMRDLLYYNSKKK